MAVFIQLLRDVPVGEQTRNCRKVGEPHYEGGNTVRGRMHCNRLCHVPFKFGNPLQTGKPVADIPFFRVIVSGIGRQGFQRLVQAAPDQPGTLVGAETVDSVSKGKNERIFPIAFVIVSSSLFLVVLSQVEIDP